MHVANFAVVLVMIFHLGNLQMPLLFGNAFTAYNRGLPLR